jgi:hypothetical protein
MPAKEAMPGRIDPAPEEAFHAFDGAKLPRPPLTKLTGLTPEEGLDALRKLVTYRDLVASPVAKVVPLILSDLAGQSFNSVAGTKDRANRQPALALRRLQPAFSGSERHHEFVGPETVVCCCKTVHPMDADAGSSRLKRS